MEQIHLCPVGQTSVFTNDSTKGLEVLEEVYERKGDCGIDL